MYDPHELARFALSESERGLKGLTDEEALTRARGDRFRRPDGGEAGVA